MHPQNPNPATPPHVQHVAGPAEVLSSETRGWNSVQLHTYRVEPHAGPADHPATAHTVAVLLQGSCDIRVIPGEEAESAKAYPGAMSLTPCGIATSWSWTGTYLLAHIHLPTTSLPVGAADLGLTDPEPGALVPHPLFRDPFIEQICLALLQELESGGRFGIPYADTLGQALALYLLRNYSNLVAAGDVPGRGLSERNLRLALDFIGDHLAENIDLGQLAGMTGLSSSSFARRFRCSTSLPVHRYLIVRRVERAKELLQDGMSSVSEVAQTVGFFDQSHLVRHFKNWTGVTPSAYRGRG
jgi:AraC family transcriptional regulator